jgi:CDP-paratose 2-epimerase
MPHGATIMSNRPAVFYRRSMRLPRGCIGMVGRICNRMSLCRKGSGSTRAIITLVPPRLSINLNFWRVSCLMAALRACARLPHCPALTGESRPIVVTGGAGFIGSNLADSYLTEGREVIVLDNLSRDGVEENLTWMTARHGQRVHPMPVDLRDSTGLAEALKQADAIFHLAAQTAVTTSLDAPIEDFEVNTRGNLNLLEALRAAGCDIPLVFASTNKVYGGLSDIPFAAGQDGYAPVDPQFSCGINETQPLDFSTPYGCSKALADQYVLDYAKTYGLRAAVFRMSCIYGPRQFGTEDQGWVAHFLISALKEEPITIYGDGQQVRDICEVSDAVAAYRLALHQFDRVTGRAFNLGGGAENAVSLRRVLREIALYAPAPSASGGMWTPPPLWPRCAGMRAIRCGATCPPSTSSLPMAVVSP